MVQDYNTLEAYAREKEFARFPKYDRVSEEERTRRHLNIYTTNLSVMFPGLPRTVARVLYINGFSSSEEITAVTNQVLLGIKGISLRNLQIIRSYYPQHGAADKDLLINPWVPVPGGWQIRVTPTERFAANRVFGHDAGTDYIDLVLRIQVNELREQKRGLVYLDGTSVLGLLLATDPYELPSTDNGGRLRAFHYFMIPWHQVLSMHQHIEV